MRISGVLLVVFLAVTGGCRREPTSSPESGVEPSRSSVSISSDGVVLAGEVIWPSTANVQRWAVLLPGSGAATVEQGGPSSEFYRELKAELLKSGTAILEYDKRGVGKSQGNLETATIQTLAADALNVNRFLRDFAGKRGSAAPVGIIGHSEGAILACSASSKGQVDFVVLLAPPMLPGREFILAQQAAVAAQDLEGEADRSVEYIRQMLDIVSAEPDDAKAAIKIKHLRQQLFQSKGAGNDRVDEARYYRQTSYFLSPWTRSIITVCPADWIAAHRQPIYFVFCTEDVQVPVEPHLSFLRSRITDPGASPNKLQVLPLDHFFQTADARVQSQTRKQFLTDLNDWLKNRVSLSKVR